MKIICNIIIIFIVNFDQFNAPLLNKCSKMINDL